MEKFLESPLIKKIIALKTVILLITFFVGGPYFYFFPDSGKDKNIRIERESISISMPFIKRKPHKILNSNNLIKVRIENLTDEEIKGVKVDVKIKNGIYIGIDSTAQIINNNIKKYSLYKKENDFLTLYNLKFFPPGSITTLYLWSNDGPSNLYDVIKSKDIIVYINHKEQEVYYRIPVLRSSIDINNLANIAYGIGFLIVFMLLLLIAKKV